MSKDVDDSSERNELVLHSPHSFGLPLLDKGERARSETLALVERDWPKAVALVEAERVPAAIAAMEVLAKEMRSWTNTDPEPWRETLLMSRLVLYENILAVGLWRDYLETVQNSLLCAIQWDVEAREHIGRLLGKIPV